MTDLATRSDIGYCIRVRPILKSAPPVWRALRAVISQVVLFALVTVAASWSLLATGNAVAQSGANAQEPPDEEPGLLDTSPGVIAGSGAMLPEDVQLLCERARAIMSNTPGTFVESIDGIFYEGDKPAEDTGCLIVVSGSWKDLEGSDDPIQRLVEILTADGWKERAEESADSPDGSAITLVKDAVACRIRGQWDGGDDTDSTYVPSDVYQVIVRCERVVTAPLLKDAD